MRVRHKPWAQEKIQAHPNIIIPNPTEQQGKWNQLFQNDHPIHVEVGTGKGKFITEMAKKYPDINFIGIEKFQSIIVTALDRVLETELENVKLLNVDAVYLPEIFAKAEIERIYLNFSDPWPKKRHTKRRLTYRDYLMKYKQVLKENGEIHFKTDNQGLFEYSLQSFSENGMVIRNISLDLHHSLYKEDNIMTEYEEKFSERGHRIYRCEAQFQA